MILALNKTDCAANESSGCARVRSRTTVTHTAAGICVRFQSIVGGWAVNGGLAYGQAHVVSVWATSPQPTNQRRATVCSSLPTAYLYTFTNRCCNIIIGALDPQHLSSLVANCQPPAGSPLILISSDLAASTALQSFYTHSVLWSHRRFIRNHGHQHIRLNFWRRNLIHRRSGQHSIRQQHAVLSKHDTSSRLHCDIDGNVSFGAVCLLLRLSNTTGTGEYGLLISSSPKLSGRVRLTFRSADTITIVSG